MLNFISFKYLDNLLLNLNNFTLCILFQAVKKIVLGCKPEICVRCREEGKIDCYQKARGIGERTEGR